MKRCSNMSYDKDHRDFLFTEKVIMQELTLEYMMKEASFMISCLESGLLVDEVPNALLLEAGENKKTNDNLFKRIIEFLKNIVIKFGEKMRLISVSNEKWLQENERILYGIDDNHGFEIEMTAYWNHIRSKLKSVGDISNGAEYTRIVNGSVSKPTEYDSVDKVKLAFYKQYVDKADKLGEGIKNSVRSGNAKVDKPDRVVLTGKGLKTIINTVLIPEVKNYKSTLTDFQKQVARITRLADNADRAFSRMTKSTSSNSVNESFCVIENSLYGDSELEMVTHVPMFEAIQSRVKSQKDINNVNKKDSASPAKVTVVKHDDTEQEEHSTKLKTSSSAQIQASKNALSVAQTVITTSMTLYEEVNIAYMNALKSVADELKRKKNKSDKDLAEDSKNTVSTNNI